MLNIQSMDRSMLKSAANDTLIRADKEFHGLAVIQQARLPVKAKVMSQTLKGIHRLLIIGIHRLLIIGMERLLEFDAHLSIGSHRGWQDAHNSHSTGVFRRWAH